MALVILTVLCAPKGAEAHLRQGTIAVDYRATVSRPMPSFAAAFRAQIYESDKALHLTVEPGHSVIVLGYLGEQFLRVDRAGVAVNRASPTSASSGLLKSAQRASSSGTAWLLEPGRTSVVWHDARVQGLAPGVDHGRWSVPLLVDGLHTQLSGEIRRLPRPALWPWLSLMGLFIAASTLLGVTRKVEAARIGSIVLGALAGVAAVAAAVAFALDTYASPGTWIAGADEIVFAAVGFGVLCWGPRQAHVPAGIGLGLLSLAVGLSKGPVFLHSLVLAALPGTASRLVVAVAIGAGTAAAVLGGFFFHLTTGSAANSAHARLP